MTPGGSVHELIHHMIINLTTQFCVDTSVQNKGRLQ